MNTSIPIDTNLYQFASFYAQQHKMSVRSLVETYLSSLRNTFDVAGKPTNNKGYRMFFHLTNCIRNCRKFLQCLLL